MHRMVVDNEIEIEDEASVEMEMEVEAEVDEEDENENDDENDHDDGMRMRMSSTTSSTTTQTAETSTARTDTSTTTCTHPKTHSHRTRPHRTHTHTCPSTRTRPHRTRTRVRVLEERTRFSKSIIWNMMRQFYDRQGIQAWAKNIVPSFITCNASIGRSYARMIVAFYSDLLVNANANGNGGGDGGGDGGNRNQNRNRNRNNDMTLDPNEKMYIVELGGGSGKLCFYILKALDHMHSKLEQRQRQRHAHTHGNRHGHTHGHGHTSSSSNNNNTIDIHNIVYVLTDFTPSNVTFWETHPGLKPYVDAGRLDFAQFDATSDTSLTCRISGKTLGTCTSTNTSTCTSTNTSTSTNTLQNPICIVANYLIDTLHHDLFQVDPCGVLKEGLVSVSVEEKVEEDEDVDVDEDVDEHEDEHGDENDVTLEKGDEMDNDNDNGDDGDGDGDGDGDDHNYDLHDDTCNGNDNDIDISDGDGGNGNGNGSRQGDNEHEQHNTHDAKKGEGDGGQEQEQDGTDQDHHDDGNDDGEVEAGVDVGTGVGMGVEENEEEGTMIRKFSNEYTYEEIDANQYYDDPYVDGNGNVNGNGNVPPCDRIHFSRILSWYQRYFSASDGEMEAKAEAKAEIEADAGGKSSSSSSSIPTSSSSIPNHKNNNSSNNTKASKGATFLLPVGFLNAIRNLSNLSHGRALVIAGDKGSSNPQRMIGLFDPHIAFHGSFSVMANFHAVAMYVLSKGGFPLLDIQEEASLQVNAFVLTGHHEHEHEHDDDGDDNDVHTMHVDHGDQEKDGMHDNILLLTMQDQDQDQDQAHHSSSLPQVPERSSKFPQLCNSFDDNINHFGPNDFYAMQRSLKEEATPSLLGIVALLKLSNWDPDIFFKFRDAILAEISKGTYSIGLRNDLFRGAKMIWNHFFLFPDRDLAFELGRLYFGLFEYDKALEMYARSIALFGDHHITHHNSGLCYSSLKNYDAAKQSFRKSLELKPDYVKAARWLENITIFAASIDTAVSPGGEIR